MASLDVESLFTNTPLEETIKICCDWLYNNQELFSNISKNQFEKILRAALCNNYILFDSIIYYLENFNEYLNTKHANIKFTNETEVNGSLPFLDVLISQNNRGFTTTAYTYWSLI